VDGVKIVVLVTHVPDPEEPAHLVGDGWRLDRSAGTLSEIDARALAIAADIRAEGDTVTALTMGAQGATTSLRRALAAGADDAVHVTDDALAGADSLATARVLAAAASHLGADLVLSGNTASDGMGGVVPAMIAEILALPHLTHIEDVRREGDRLTGRRVSGPVSRSVSAPFPLVASVVEQAGEPLIPNFAGMKAARSKPIETLSLADFAAPEIPGAAWSVTLAEPTATRERAELIDDVDEAVGRIVDLLAGAGVIGGAR
jgi:electron transfer flavoprotein beta subunit